MYSCCYADEKELSKAVKTEIERYPGQRLIDIYKTFFQGYFGPAHLISDSNQVIEYLKEELKDSNESNCPDFCALPPNGKYVRANLRLIKQGKVPIELFAKAFMKSARQIEPNDIVKWKATWGEIIAEIEKQNPNLPKFQEDKEYINSVLAKNEYVVHHSEEFITKYHPHYRVITNQQMNVLAKNLKFYFGPKQQFYFIKSKTLL